MAKRLFFEKHAPHGREILSSSMIASRVGELAQEILRDYTQIQTVSGAAPGLDIVTVMSGSLFFAADLLRLIPLRFRLFCVSASSYRGARETTGQVRLDEASLPEEFAPEILVIDDILDTGLTLAAVKSTLTSRAPSSRLKICVLLRKNAPRRVEIEADYFGFNVDNRFVAGYGLDDAGYYRNLPGIIALD